MFQRNDPCWCGTGKKMKKCDPICQPSQWEELKKKYQKKYQIHLKTPEEIAGIRQACKLAAEILMKTCAQVKAGVTTSELNTFAHRLHREAGATPAPLNYGKPPFPKSVCISLNDVICHGIPDDTPLKEGDILNIDVTCILNGYYGDCSRMVTIGEVSPENKKLIRVTYECLMNSIAILRPGVLTCEIGEAIESHAEKHRFSTVYQFVGHGVGLYFHENPQVHHNRNRQRIPLAPGMTFTIEPMINAGVPEAKVDPYDGWTARTQDGKASAQFEHTILITETGYEILTNWTFE